MASLTTHCIVAVSLALPALSWERRGSMLPGWQLTLCAGLFAAAPDLDLALKKLFGIPGASLLSHRGLFHSPFFLIAFAAVLAAVITSRSSGATKLSLWLLLAGCLVTHPLLDALTDGGHGIMLLLPFSQARLFFPWHPIHNPPETEHILWRALLVRPSEIPFCVTALLGGIAGLQLQKRLRLTPGEAGLPLRKPSDSKRPAF